MENEESITIGSIVSVGKYEILYATAPYIDESNGEIENVQTVQYLNNAHVKYNEVHLHYKIDWQENGKSINAINFSMPIDKKTFTRYFCDNSLWINQEKQNRDRCNYIGVKLSKK